MMRARILSTLAFAGVLMMAGMAPAAAALPSQILDLRNWYLTIPTDADGNGADSVYQPQLASYSSQWMQDSGTGGVRFKAPVAGTPGTGSTSGSSYLRSELREMNGSQKAAWTANDGYLHVMTVREAFTHLPANKPDVVGAQIHDDGGADPRLAEDVVEIKVHGPLLFVESAGVNVATLDTNYRLGTTFTVVISADFNGVDVSYNGVQKLSNFFPVSTHGGWYFKAGAYTHSNTTYDVAGEYGESVITQLTVQHSQLPPPTCAGRLATIKGTAGPDVVYGTPGADVIVGGGGNDAIYGLGGNDLICGDTGNDRLKGGGGNDKLIGSSGNDRLAGGGGRDVCKGGPGLDRAKACEVVRSL